MQDTIALRVSHSKESSDPGESKLCGRVTREYPVLYQQGLANMAWQVTTDYGPQLMGRCM